MNETVSDHSQKFLMSIIEFQLANFSVRFQSKLNLMRRENFGKTTFRSNIKVQICHISLLAFQLHLTYTLFSLCYQVLQYPASKTVETETRTRRSVSLETMKTRASPAKKQIQRASRLIQLTMGSSQASLKSLWPPLNTWSPAASRASSPSSSIASTRSSIVRMSSLVIWQAVARLWPSVCQ